MTSPTGTPPMDAITSLLAERQRYEAWIATLETRRGSTPAHVYERVRADYEKRLTAVMDQLAGRSGDLESTVNSLAARVAELMGEETTKRDERAEAELRAAVGEFTPEQWSEISSKSDAEIARIAAQRGTIGSELAQVQDLLVQATRKSEALTPRSAAIVQAEVNAAIGQASSPRPAAPPMAAAPSASPPPTSPAPSSERGGRDAMLPDFDELAFLKSVVEPRDAAARQAAAAAAAAAAAPRPSVADRAPASPPPADVAPPPAPAPAARPAAAPEAPRALADSATADHRGGYMSAADLAARGLTMGGAGTSAPAPPRAQAAGAPPAPAASAGGAGGSGPSTSPSDSPAGASAAGAAAAAASASRSEGLRMSNSVPAFLKDVPAEQAKTLKCQECGTMNYPTEWYCERCGGELAAM